MKATRTVATSLSSDSPARNRRGVKKLQDIGIEIICEQIIAGVSYRELAEKYKVLPAEVCWFLALEENISISRESRKMSAEAWLDRGLEELKAAVSKEDVMRARYIAEHCQKRAALLNPAEYSERINISVEKKVDASAALEDARRRVRTIGYGAVRDSALLPNSVAEFVPIEVVDGN